VSLLCVIFRIKENAGSDRSWVWNCNDFSEEKTEVVTLALRLANSENAVKFKDQFTEAQKTNASKSTSPDGAAAALEGLSVKGRNLPRRFLF